MCSNFACSFAKDGISRQFARRNSDVCGICQSDEDLARITLHGLAGIARSVGALQMGQRQKAMQKLCRNLHVSSYLVESMRRSDERAAGNPPPPGPVLAPLPVQHGLSPTVTPLGLLAHGLPAPTTGRCVPQSDAGASYDTAACWMRGPAVAQPTNK